MPSTVRLPPWCHFRVHEALFSRAAVNLVRGLKPPVRLWKGLGQWERSALEEGRQHLHDRSRRVSWAGGAKSLRGEARVEDCRGTRVAALGVHIQIQGRGTGCLQGGFTGPGTGASAQFGSWTTWSVGHSVSARRHRGLSKAPSGWRLGAALRSLVPSAHCKLRSSPPRVRVDGCRGSADNGSVKASAGDSNVRPVLRTPILGQHFLKLTNVCESPLNEDSDSDEGNAPGLQTAFE